MPQTQVLVYLKETGEPTLMHSIDAAEALRLGDYVSDPPGNKEPTAEQRAAAMAQAKSGIAPKPPELMTPEEREAARAEANAMEVARLDKLQLPIPLALQQAVKKAPARSAPAVMKEDESPKAAVTAHTTKADAKDDEAPKAPERHVTHGRSER